MTTKSVQVKIELGHKASLRKKLTTEGFTHDWTVFIRGPEGSNIQHFVEKCVFYLHDSFPKPKRAVKEPPYQISESGYGSFNLPVEIYFKTKEEPRKIRFEYDLFLHLDDAPPVNHVRCEKLTFKNPTEDFRRKLIKAGGVGIPGAGDGPAVTLTASGSSPHGSQPHTAESQAFTDLFGGHADEHPKHGDSSHSKKRKSHSKDKVRDKDRARSKSTSSGHHHQTTPSQPTAKPSSPHTHSHDKSTKSGNKRPNEEPAPADPAPAKKKKKDKEKDKDRERSKSSSSSKPSSSSREKHEKHKSSKTPLDGVKSATHAEKVPEKERDHSREKHRHRERSSESSQSKSHKKSHKDKHSERPAKQELPKTLSPQKDAKSPSKSKSEHSHSGYKRPKSIIPSVEVSQKLALSDSAGEASDIDPCEDTSPDLTPNILGSSQSSTTNLALESRSKNFMQSLLAEQSDDDSMDEEVDVEGGTSPKVSQLFTPPTLSPPKLSPPKFSSPKLSPPKLVLPKMSPPKVVPPKVSPSRSYPMESEASRLPTSDTQSPVTGPTAASYISPPKVEDRHRKHSASPQKQASSDKTYSSHSSQGKRHKSHPSPSLPSPGNLTTQKSRSDKDRTLPKSRENSGKRREIDSKEKESIKHSSPIPVKPKEPEIEFTSIKEQDTRPLSSQKSTVSSKRKEPEMIKEKELSWGGSPQSTVVAKRRDPEANKERDSSPAVWGSSQNTVLAKSNKISPPRFGMDPPDLLKSTKDSDLFGFQSSQRSIPEREKENQRNQHLTNGSTACPKPTLMDADTLDTQLMPGCAPNGEAFELLLGLQQKLNATKDETVLSEVVRILEDSGEVFSMTDASLDFDLCYVNSDTVHKLKHCLQLA